MGIRSQAVLQLGPAPKNQEKCFNIIFLIPTPPPFFGGGGVELGARELAVLETCSKPDALLKVS